MSELRVALRTTVLPTSVVARRAQCPACASREVDDGPGEFDPVAWTAPLACRCCGHLWSVSC